jgi:membrane associated rhomboid family serine protease
MKNIGTLSPPANPPVDPKMVIRATALFPFLTLTLVVANLLIWQFCCSPTVQDADGLVDAFAFSPVKLSSAIAHDDAFSVAGEVLRSVSSLYVHERDFSHVGLNMLFLALFGVSVERRLGRGRFAILYLATGVLTCAAYFVICPDGRPSFGASSAVCGVLSAYITLFLKRRPFTSLIPLAVLVLNLYGATNPDAVAMTGFTFFAHLIGFVIGFLATLVLSGKPAPRPL